MRIVYDSMAEKAELFCHHPNQATEVRHGERGGFYLTSCPDCPQTMATVYYPHPGQMPPWLKERQ